MRTSIVIVGLAVVIVSVTAFGQSLGDHRATFFVGRVQYGKNDGDSCGGVGRNMAKIVSQVSTIPVRDAQKVALTSDELFETPFLFMNGHNDFVLSELELRNLRVYLDHGGFLFASGCCTNPAFPRAWRREMNRVIAGETVRPLAYDHPIYSSFYRIERVRCLTDNREIHLEGLFHEGRLVAVLGEEGLCCAFSANNSCNVGRGVSPEDGKRLALNIAVYAMTH